MKTSRDKLSQKDVQRNLTLATTQHGYALNDTATEQNSPGKIIGALLIAACLLTVTFFLKPIDFWLALSFTMIILAAVALFCAPSLINRLQFSVKNAVLALLVALIFYLLCLSGRIIISRVIPSWTVHITALYDLAQGYPAWLIAIIILFIAAPAEEIFWRGFIQNALSSYLTPTAAIIITAILYAALHICSFNPLLVIAAFVGGLLWGALYAYRGSVLTVICSHMLWSIVIFMLLPLV